MLLIYVIISGGLMHYLQQRSITKALVKKNAKKYNTDLNILKGSFSWG